MLFLGIDLGSSAVKLAVVDGHTGKTVGSTTYPETEFSIDSPQAGWAEQDPEVWWDAVVKGFQKLIHDHSINALDISGIGIAYQMHGLVLVDKKLNVIRPSIIWCDSRATHIESFYQQALDENYRASTLNHLGNFTAAKLAWVFQNEPHIAEKIHAFMLPGDYIAMRLSGECTTTHSGLSEGILWDFNQREVSQNICGALDINPALIPKSLPAFSDVCRVSETVATELGIRPGTPISYRGGDQPNNALSLNVSQAGDVAATAGTSGVVYAVTDKKVLDPAQRVNTFVHVTDTSEQQTQGVLLCINGAGRAYSWIKSLLNIATYPELNALAENIQLQENDLTCFPFGNGSERISANTILGGTWKDIDFNRHGQKHMAHATLESVAFSMAYGFHLLENLGCSSTNTRAGHGNMFLSPLFSQIYCDTTQVPLALYNTNGAEGAARGAAIGTGYYASCSEAFDQISAIYTYEPDAENTIRQTRFRHWSDEFERLSSQVSNTTF